MKNKFKKEIKMKKVLLLMVSAVAGFWAIGMGKGKK